MMALNSVLGGEGLVKGMPFMRARMNELNYYDVQLLKDDLCGTGSYGSVCKAMVDQLVCAAKIIHPTFFSVETSPSSTKTMNQFEKECDFLSAIRHPCIVQYLGTIQDIETGLPVLLMELMDESLTKFLDRTLHRGKNVPYHLQVNLCHDVAMALAFLHSNGIVHRDLSSNNILLIGGTKAKVTDFGMSRLIEKNPRMTPLTQCPGTLVYMAPEALRMPPTYSDKLDVFSMGVCIIQILTCHFPKPSDAKRTVQDPRHGTIEVPIPERDRRKNDIKRVRGNNPLFDTALDCLSDYEENRPSSKDLCHRMIYYKSCEQYSDSVAQEDSLADRFNRMERDVLRKDREIASLQVELENRITEMNSLQESYERRLERVLEENRRLREELEERVHNNCDTLGSIPSCSRQSKSPSAQSLDEDFEKLMVDNMQSSSVIEEQLSLGAPPSTKWYHGPISRIVACQRLESVGKPGGYLIRESYSERGTLVLSFLDRDKRIHHFRIVRSSQGQFNIGGNIWFSSLSNLVGFHSQYSSVMEKHSERLDVPIPPPVLVPLPGGFC